MWHERATIASAIAPPQRGRNAFSKMAKMTAARGEMHRSFAVDR
jgi:hypothetical protein